MSFEKLGQESVRSSMREVLNPRGEQPASPFKSASKRSRSISIGYPNGGGLVPMVGTSAERTGDSQLFAGQGLEDALVGDVGDSLRKDNTVVEVTHTFDAHQNTPDGKLSVGTLKVSVNARYYSSDPFALDGSGDN